MSDYNNQNNTDADAQDEPRQEVATQQQDAPEDAAELRKQRAKEFYEQWKGGAQNAGREYIMRQTPLEIQGEMEELVGEEFGTKLPLDDVENKLWQIDEKGVHPTKLKPGTPLFVQRQIAAQISEYVGMQEEIPNAEEMLENPDDAGAIQPPVSGSPTPHLTDESSGGGGSAPPTHPPQALDAPPQQPAA